MAGLLSLGARAMFANQAALQTIGQNIANANTPGYSRQSVVLTTSPGQYTGAGFFGKGVDVQTVQRSHNEFLTKEAASSKSTAVADSTRAEQLSRLEKLFKPGTDGIGNAAGQFLNAMVDVTSRPSDPSARQVALGRANELAVRFANAGQQLSELQAGVVSDLKANVDVINQLAKQIASVNDQIAKTRGSGHTPNDLLDQREQLISKLGERVAVSTLPADDDTVGVFIGGGQRLVLGNSASTLQISGDNYDAQRAVVSITEGSITRPLDESVLTGGSVAALLRFQNKDLQDAKNLLGQLAAAIGTRVNTQNSLGLDLSNPPGKGAPIFNVAPPRVLPASTNQRNASGSFVNGVQASIVDASQLQASSYRLTSSAAGSYQLTRLSDGLVRNVNSGDIVDGFQLSFAPGFVSRFRIGRVTVGKYLNVNGLSGCNLPSNGTPCRVEGSIVVNPGSVGQPRDRIPGACWALWDTESHAVELRRETYDASAEIAACRERDPHLPYLADVLTRTVA
ncbi:MAG: flagellar hook-associated protein FlgK [Proteobacteria bacterium]|nr:flagellar hook-associated protein FlgK [Pseudomonadota bacterium]